MRASEYVAWWLVAGLALGCGVLWFWLQWVRFNLIHANMRVQELLDSLESAAEALGPSWYLDSNDVEALNMEDG